ncbi:MAG: hypothetical protein ACK5B9_04795 [Flavobacteriia bacterium]|jgi:hypothetical protein
MKSILLFSSFFVLFFANNFFSQLKIVKDNIACTYGLKNEIGTWVLEPTYILIEDLQNGYFKTLTEGGKGVFYQTKHIIPNEYEEIYPENNNFKVIKDSKMGIISPEGQMIVPAEFSSLLFDMNQFICYKHVDYKYSSTVISIHGTVTIPETAGFIKPFSGQLYSLIGDQIFEYSASGNAGLIGIDGKLIVPRIYDRLRICNDNLTFVKDFKIGVINLKNEVILEGKPFLTPLSYDNYNEIPCIQSDAIYKFFENGKYGIMKGNGEILHAATIDSIGRSFHEVSNEKTTYIFKSNGKYGFISQDGEITENAIYEHITPKPRLNWENDYLKKKKIFFLVLKNNRFGLVGDDGKEQIPCEFNRFYRLDYAKKPNYAISKMNEVFYLDFEKDTLKLQKMTLINEDKIIDLYTFKNEYFAFEVSKFEKGKNIISGLLPLYAIGKFIFVTRENKNQLYTLDGKPWTKYKECYVNHQVGKYALIQTKINSQGLLNLYTGKIILDTNFAEISQFHHTSNVLWAKLKVGEVQIKQKRLVYNQNGIDMNPINLNFEDSYMAPKYKWIPFDTLGNKLTKSTFDKYFGNYDTQILSEYGLFGVLEKNFKWLISPQFKAILKFSATSYLVQSKGEKYGLLDINKGFVIDTIYDHLETVYKGKLSETDFENTIGAMQYDKEYWVKFGNSENEFLFSSLGEKLDKNHPLFKTKLLQFALLANSNYDSKAFRIRVNQSDFSYLLKNTEKPNFTDFQLTIYDHFKQLFDLDKGCNFLDQSPCFQKKIYELIAFGEKFVSAKNSTYASDLNFDNIRNEMMPFSNKYIIDIQNLIWNENKLIKITLDSIFGKGNLFENELLAAIKKRDDLKLDCSSIDQLVDNFNDVFWFSEKGIHLQYDKNGNGYQAVEILIPIENLKKHRQTSWFTLYLR